MPNEDSYEVSIHAPVKGATFEAKCLPICQDVSIHALVRGRRRADNMLEIKTKEH
jgi:hypothetical protein